MNKGNPFVLILHPGTLGDVVLAVGAIRKISKAFSFHHLKWVGQSEVGKILLACGEVHEVIGIEGSFVSQLFTYPGKFDGRSKEILRGCTHCVCWMKDHDEYVSRNLESLGIRSIVQSPKALGFDNFHYEERFIRCLSPWGIEVDSIEKRVPLLLRVSTQCDFKYWKRRFTFLDNPYVVIHPGSGSHHKCVSPSFMAEVARRLLNKNSEINLVILSGPADQSQAQSLLDEIRGGNTHLVSNQRLSVVAGLLKKAALYIGHDSGISHLAAGLGISSILLFGPTKPCLWAPRGDHVTVIQGPSCQCADWKEVQRCHRKPCLELSIDTILQTAEELVPMNGKSRITNFKSQMD
jgi:heptosyltransferase-3